MDRETDGLYVFQSGTEYLIKARPSLKKKGQKREIMNNSVLRKWKKMSFEIEIGIEYKDKKIVGQVYGVCKENM